MYTLRNRPVLALASEDIHREAVVWCAWIIATAGGASLQVVEGSPCPNRTDGREAPLSDSDSGGANHSKIHAARRLAAVQRPAMLVADWADPNPQEVLRLASSYNASAVLLRWPKGCNVSRVLVSSGGGPNSLGQLWIAKEIAFRCGCPAKVLHVVCEEPCHGGDGGPGWSSAVVDIQSRMIGLPGPLEVTVANNVVSGIAATTQPDDLVAIGAPNHYRMPEHFEDSIPHRIAQRLPNPLMLFFGRKPSRPRLREVFWPQMIRLGLSTGSKEEAIALLVNTLIRHEQVPRAWRDRLLEVALARERAASTGVGCETAFPHITFPDCTGVAGCLGVFPEGLDFGDESGRKTRFVFLLVTPEDCYDEYLAVLGKLAELMALPELRKDLLSCRTPTDVLNVLAADEAPPAAAQCPHLRHSSQEREECDNDCH